MVLFTFSNITHERAMRLVYDDRIYSSSDELLIKDKSVSIHERNFQSLEIEIFKVKNVASTGLTENIFEFDDKSYDLRNNSILLRKKTYSNFLRNGSLSSLALEIWKLKIP